ncbi:MAG: hypothetical protein V3V78_00595 [Candidatus Woesearchaeota archaeon]
MKVRNLPKLKNWSLSIGIIIILLYLILSLVESEHKFVSFIVLIPVLIWPYVAYKHERQAGIMAFVVGSITIVWFVIDFLFLRADRLYWHIPMFLLIAPLPAFLLGWIFLYYSKNKK